MLKRRALFGGTFDPVHHGHLAAAREVRDLVAIEDFRFLPAGEPPHRAGTFADRHHRRRMLELALAGEKGFSIDDRELRRSGPSYMSDTLADWRREHPDDALILVLGQDSLNSLDRWHDWRRIPELAHLVVMSRPGETPAYRPELAQLLAGRVRPTPEAMARERAGCLLSVAVSPHDISSSGLRQRVHDPEALRRQVPSVVADYIEAERLYGLGAKPA